MANRQTGHRGTNPARKNIRVTENKHCQSRNVIRIYLWKRKSSDALPGEFRRNDFVISNMIYRKWNISMLLKQQTSV